MPENLRDLIEDLPAELADDGVEASDDDATDTSTNEGAEDDDTTTDDDTNTDDASDDDAEGEDDKNPAAGDADDDTDDDFVSTIDDDAEVPAAVVQTTENQFILNGLQKISVDVIGPDDKVATIQVYGYNDLPRNIKGFASVYGEKQFDASVAAQETRARELQTEYRTNSAKAATEAYTFKENKMVADDLTELRQEGIFPKFKGVPGSKEFNESAGAKEFDRVVKYMNEQNDKYGKAATQDGKAFRHIGFREAYIMINGPDTKAAERREQAARKTVAGKIKSGRGAGANERVVETKRVANITDLAGEFEAFAGGGS